MKRLTEHLRAYDGARLELSFDEVEAIVGSPLPPSARRHQPWWSNSTRWARFWLDAGYRASFARVASGRVAFVREDSLGERRGKREDGQRPTALPLAVDAVLVGCVATKASAPAPGKDLYQSELFLRRRAYAEASGRPWFILSALYGLVGPDDVIEPYDVNMTEVTGARRRSWVEKIMGRLEEELGALTGLVLEVHAGADYRNALGPALRAAEATLVNPLEGLRLGEQLHWYDTVGTPDSAAPVSQSLAAATPLLARSLTEAFVNGDLDLSERPGAPPAGWEGMPEVAVARALRGAGADDAAVRLLITFTAALDRARDADRLWFSALELWRHEPWVFEPTAAAAASLTDLQDALRSSSVSQRHMVDSMAWRLIAETLACSSGPTPFQEAVFQGQGDASALLATLHETTQAGTPRTPMLAGPKVGPMWVRMLAYPGGAAISSLQVLPVAVDVQVRKVTEYLGLTRTRGQDLDKVRAEIQAAWQRDVRDGGAVGPDPLDGTCSALDPALWFFGKWGCTFCEARGVRRPIAGVCADCKLELLGR